MPDSTLDVVPSTPPVTDKGHGTLALGPSNTSDSGSDLQGPGVYEIDAEALDLDSGINEDVVQGTGAGRDIGDANLDSDSDADGTGERASAGRDIDADAASDIAPDRLIGSQGPVPRDVLDRIASEAPDDDSDSDEDGETER